MLKNAYFLEKYCKNCLSLGGSAPETPFASNGWGLHSQTPVSLLSPTITTLSSLCLAFKCVLLFSKKDKITPVHVLILLFRTFAPIFCFKLCRFYDGGRKNISCPRAQGALVTPLCRRLLLPRITQK